MAQSLQIDPIGWILNKLKRLDGALALLSTREAGTTTIVEQNTTNITNLLPAIAVTPFTLWIDPVNGSDNNEGGRALGGGRFNAPLRSFKEAFVRIGTPKTAAEYAQIWTIILQGTGTFQTGPCTTPTGRFVICIPPGMDVIWGGALTLRLVEAERFGSTLTALLAVTQMPLVAAMPLLDGSLGVTSPGQLSRFSRAATTQSAVVVSATGWTEGVELSFKNLYLGRVIPEAGLAGGQIIVALDTCMFGWMGEVAPDTRSISVHKCVGCFQRAAETTRVVDFMGAFDTRLHGTLDVESTARLRNCQPAAPTFAYAGPDGSFGIDYATNFFASTVLAAKKTLEEDETP